MEPEKLLTDLPTWAYHRRGGGVKLPPLLPWYRQFKPHESARRTELKKIWAERRDQWAARGRANAQNAIPRGNLDFWEYRFWQGSRDPNDLRAICRWCTAEVNAVDWHGRHRHYDHSGCSTNLVKAYSTLRKWKMCAGCRSKATRWKWGVPFCSATCQRVWMFDVAQPYTLKCAMGPAAKPGPIAGLP